MPNSKLIQFILILSATGASAAWLVGFGLRMRASQEAAKAALAVGSVATPSDTGEGPVPRGAKILSYLLLALNIGAAVLSADGATHRIAAVASGLLVGGLMHVACFKSHRTATPEGVFALLLVLVGAGAATLQEPSIRIMAGMIVIVGAAVPPMACALWGLTDRAMSGAVAAAATATMVGAGIWGERLIEPPGTTWAFACSLSAAQVVIITLARQLPPSWQTRATIIVPLVAATGAWSLGANSLMIPDLALAFALGSGFAAVTGLIINTVGDVDRAPPALLGLTLLMIVGGGGMLLANRVAGIVGVGLLGMAFLPLVLGPNLRCNWMAAVLATVCGARSLLQWVLEEGRLAPSGVVITEPYAFAGLTAGLALVAICWLWPPRDLLLPARGTAAQGIWVGVLGVAAILGPVGACLIGGPHVLPATILGMLAGVLIFGALGNDAGSDRARGMVMVPMILVTAALCALWGSRLAGLVNVPIFERSTVVGATALLLAVVVSHQLRNQSPRGLI